MTDGMNAASPRIEPSAAEDFEVMFPDVDVEVRDPDTGEEVTVTVREFRFLDGLHAQSEARELIASFGVAIDEVKGEVDVDVEVVMDALTEHADVWIGLIARATGRDPDWIARLAEPDGIRLSTAMWKANRSFFVRGVLAHLRPAGASPSPKSSMRSSGPDTGEDTGTSPDD